MGSMRIDGHVVLRDDGPQPGQFTIDVGLVGAKIGGNLDMTERPCGRQGSILKPRRSGPTCSCACCSSRPATFRDIDPKGCEDFGQHVNLTTAQMSTGLLNMRSVQVGGLLAIARRSLPRRGFEAVDLIGAQDRRAARHYRREGEQRFSTLAAPILATIS